MVFENEDEEESDGEGTESEEGNETGGDSSDDKDEGFDEDENNSAGSEEEEFDVMGAARWKENIAAKAKEGFVQRQLNVKNLHAVRLLEQC